MAEPIEYIGPHGWRVQVITRGDLKAYLVTQFGSRPLNTSSGFCLDWAEIAATGCPTGELQEVFPAPVILPRRNLYSRLRYGYGKRQKK